MEYRCIRSCFRSGAHGIVWFALGAAYIGGAIEKDSPHYLLFSAIVIGLLPVRILAARLGTPAA